MKWLLAGFIAAAVLTFVGRYRVLPPKVYELPDVEGVALEIECHRSIMPGEWDRCVIREREPAPQQEEKL